MNEHNVACKYQIMMSGYADSTVTLTKIDSTHDKTNSLLDLIDSNQQNNSTILNLNNFILIVKGGIRIFLNEN